MHADVFSGGALLVIAAAYGRVALGIPRGGAEPGPGALPLALAVLLAALSIGVLARGLAAGRAGARQARPAEPPEPGDAAARLGPWLAAAATLAYAGLFEPLGFVPATLAYTAIVTRLFGGRRRALIVAPVGVTLALFAFFRLALGVRLPPGLLG